MNAILKVKPQSTYTATVSPWGFEMECDYEYDEGEAPILWPLERSHPGYPPTAFLYACRVGGVDIIEMIDDSQRERIEDVLLEGAHE